MARITISGGRDHLLRQEARQAAQDYDEALLDLTSQWDSLPAVAKTFALRRMLVILARSVHYLLRQSHLA